jgi:hypothetical protein
LVIRARKDADAVVEYNLETEVNNHVLDKLKD